MVPVVQIFFEGSVMTFTCSSTSLAKGLKVFLDSDVTGDEPEKGSLSSVQGPCLIASKKPRSMNRGFWGKSLIFFTASSIK